MNSMRFKLVLLLFVGLSHFSYSAEHLSDHEVFCAAKPELPCLEVINMRLMQEQPLSDNWFKIQSYKLDYLYDMQRYDDLYLEIEPLLEQPNLPIVFTSQLNFYFAKTLGHRGEKERALVYANKMLEQVEGMFEAFGDPLRIVELANMQAVFGDSKRAYQMLLLAQTRFAKSRDPNFGFELNEQFANVFYHWGNYEKAVYHRKIAVSYAREIGHRGKLSVAISNLARTLQLNGNLEEAAQYYNESLQYTSGSSEARFRTIYLLRLTEVYLALKKIAEAKTTFDSINLDDLPLERVPLYQQLHDDLNL